MNESVLLAAGMETLINTLGEVEAERFISIILREPFDYTEWRKTNIREDKSFNEIMKDAAKVCAENEQYYKRTL